MRRLIFEKRGSATVEAAVSFVGFLLVIFTILGLVRLCRAQMLISTAVDTAAKELSQYSYFYEMSGLQKFDKDFSTKVAGPAKDRINEVIGSVDGLYSSLGNAYEQTAEDATNLYNATQNNQLDISSLESAISNINDSAADIETSAAAMKQQFEKVGDNPILYMKSLVAIAGEEGMELAKRAIAVCLSEYFVEKTLSAGTDDVDGMLTSMGVIDGMDGLNFSASSIFCDDDRENVEIVVAYKIKVLAFFDFEISESTVFKRATCRAWLGGDDVLVKVDNTTTVTPEAGDGGETGGATEGEKGESGGATDPETNTSATAVLTGLWVNEDDPTDGISELQVAFSKQLDAEYNVELLTGNLHYNPYDTDGTAAYSCLAYEDWPFPYQTMGGNTVNPGANRIITSMRGGFDIMGYAYASDGVTNVEFNSYTHVVYVPENLPDDQLQQLYADIEIAKEQMNEYKNSKEELSSVKTINVIVKKSGGTYGYSNSES